MFQIHHSRRQTLPQQFAEELILLEQDPGKLINIIHSLLDKSKTLIQSLEKALSKIEMCENEATFWKDRYYKFKRNCEVYGGVDSSFLDSYQPKEQLNQLRQQNQSLKFELESLRQRTMKLSPRFGNNPHSRHLTTGLHEASFNYDSSLQSSQNYKVESLQSTDRFFKEPDERMGPKHISRFKFSSKKRNVSNFGERQ